MPSPPRDDPDEPSEVPAADDVAAAGVDFLRAAGLFSGLYGATASTACRWCAAGLEELPSGDWVDADTRGVALAIQRGWEGTTEELRAAVAAALAGPAADAES